MTVNYMRNLIDRFIDILISLIENDTYDKISKCDILFICHDVDRGEIKDGLPYSKLIDSCYEELISKGFKCQQLARPFSKLVNNKAWAKPYSINRNYLLVRIFDSLIKFISFKRSRNNKIVKFYKRLFNLCEPKFIISIDTNRHICNAARDYGIPIAEILHGFGYQPGEWNWINEKKINLPSHILSFDEVSTKSFSILEKSKDVSVQEFPHPWYKRFSIIQRNELDSEWINRPDFLPSQKKCLLISLGWGYDNDHGKHTFMKGILRNGLFYEELIHVIQKTKEEIFWCVRRHPVHLHTKRYKHQLKILNDLINKYENVEWEKSSETSLISLLNHVDAHITMMSMTAYDAALLGVKTLFLCPSLGKNNVNEKLFNDLVQKGYAIKSYNDEKFILDWALNVKKTEPLKLTDATDEDWNNFMLQFKEQNV